MRRLLNITKLTLTGLLLTVGLWHAGFAVAANQAADRNAMGPIYLDNIPADMWLADSPLEMLGAEDSRTPFDVTEPDWVGLKQDTFYFLFFQFGVIAGLYLLPETVSSWSGQDKEDGLKLAKYKDNIRSLVWDKDKWYVNYITHPYWGGTYSVRARERGFGPVGAFWYSALLSTLYEYGAEAIFEKPSIQDMIVTPLAGYFVGKYFMDIRHGIKQRAKREKLSLGDRTMLVVTDPIGVLSRWTNSKLGIIDEGLELQPFIGMESNQNRVVSENGNLVSNDSRAWVIGLKLHYRW